MQTRALASASFLTGTTISVDGDSVKLSSETHNLIRAVMNGLL